MTGQQGGGDGGERKPPAAMLAAALKHATEDPAQRAAEAHVPPASGPAPGTSLDQHYIEPPTNDSFRARLAACAHPDTMVAQLANELIARVEDLEGALRPFTTHAFMIANARLMLQAAGRIEPAGGCWVSMLDNIKVMPNEPIFYNALDVFGRAKAEANMENIFKTMQAAADHQASKVAHVAAGGRADH